MTSVNPLSVPSFFSQDTKSSQHFKDHRPDIWVAVSTLHLRLWPSQKVSTAHISQLSGISLTVAFKNFTSENFITYVLKVTESKGRIVVEPQSDRNIWRINRLAAITSPDKTEHWRHFPNPSDPTQDSRPQEPVMVPISTFEVCTLPAWTSSSHQSFGQSALPECSPTPTLQGRTPNTENSLVFSDTSFSWNLPGIKLNPK